MDLLKPPILKLGPPTLKLVASPCLLSPTTRATTARDASDACFDSQETPTMAPVTGSSKLSPKSTSKSTTKLHQQQQQQTPDDSSNSSSQSSPVNRRGQRKRIPKNHGPDFVDPSQLGYASYSNKTPSSDHSKCSICNESVIRKSDLMHCFKCSSFSGNYII